MVVVCWIWIFFVVKMVFNFVYFWKWINKIFIINVINNKIIILLKVCLKVFINLVLIVFCLKYGLVIIVCKLNCFFKFIRIGWKLLIKLLELIFKIK